ncbi:two-component regulator propeller domain-containing protein [Treponema primitia]|uniref:two-component regulator propeller domain-containing protein n=1 Tax=Treponema primitia TaxID=88058 RepID=UPI0018E10D8C|nr:two-component regulator propeller domain-containing protein [Treponema primitia]
MIRRLIRLTPCLILLALTPLFGDEWYASPVPDTRSLASRDIYKIRQDRQGFLWILTANGLYRYDGRSFLQFNYHPGADPRFSFQDAKFTAWAEDDQGFLWIGTNRGLHRFDPLSFETDSFRDEVFADQVILDIVGSTTGLWVLTDAGLYRKGGASFEELSLPGGGHAGAIAQDSGGMLLAGSWEGQIFRMEGGSFRAMGGVIPQGIRHIRSRGATIIAVTGSGDTGPDRVYAIREYGADLLCTVLAPVGDLLLLDETLLIACTSGEASRGTGTIGGSSALYEYRFQDRTISPLEILPNHSLYTLFRDAQDTIWLGGWDTSLVKLRRKNEYVTILPHSLGEDAEILETLRYLEDETGLWVYTGEAKVYHIFPGKEPVPYGFEGPADFSQFRVAALVRDTGGSLWAGTSQGLYRLDSGAGLFRRVLEGGIYGLEMVPGDGGDTLWAGMRRGVIRFNPSRGEQYFYSLEHGPAEQFFCSRSGELWVSAGIEGLYRLQVGRSAEPGEFVFYTAPYDMTLGSALEDTSGRVWFRTGSSLFFYDDAADRLQRCPVPGVLVWDIGPDASGGLLIAAEAGAFRYDSASGELVRLSAENDGPVLSLFRDTGGILWAGTYGGGLIAISEGTPPVRYGPGQGLPDTIVYSVLEDRKNRLWVLTRKGPALLNRPSGELTPLSLGEDLEGDYFLQWGGRQTGTGKFIFLGRRDIVFFDPEQSIFNPAAFPFSISAVHLRGRLLPPAAWRGEKPLFIPWGRGPAEISFALLDYEHPGDVQYDYSFSTAENSWIPLGSRNTLTLGDMAGGKHTIHLRARSPWNSFDPSLHTLTLPLYVQAVFWKRPLAWVVYAAMFIAILGTALLLYRQKQLLRLNRMKLDLISHISERVFNPLSIVKNSIYELIKRLPLEERMDSQNRWNSTVNSINEFKEELHTILSVSQPETPNDAGAEVESENSSEKNPDKEKPLILVVQGDLKFVETLDSGFSGDFNIIKTASVQEAYLYLEESNPDIILLDKTLSDGSGYDLLKKIQEHPRTRNIPVVFLAVPVSPEEIVAALEQGAADYVAKPFVVDELRARIKNVLSRNRASAATVVREIKELIDGSADPGGTVRKLPGKEIRLGIYKKKNLSPKEQDIVEYILLMGNAPYKSFAEKLGIQHQTLRNNATKIFGKLGISTRQELRDKLIDEAASLDTESS